MNVKWDLKRENLLDVTESAALDHCLVFTGPASAAATSRGGTRPWNIAAVYVFDAQQLLDELRARGVKTGVAASVRAAQWEAAEIFPRANNELLTVDPEQARLLRLFAPPAGRRSLTPELGDVHEPIGRYCQSSALGGVKAWTRQRDFLQCADNPPLRVVRQWENLS